MPLDDSIRAVEYSVGKPNNYGFVSEIKDRKITKETCQRYGVRIAQDAEGNVIKHLSLLRQAWYACRQQSSRS